MPARDGTGPAGKGPKTGRGLGNCNPGDSNRSMPLTQRRGRADGRGRSMWNSTPGQFLGHNETDSTKTK